MEEALKLILEKITSLNEEQKDIKSYIKYIKSRLNKIDMSLEHEIQPKITALFETRDISLHCDEVTY